MEQSVDIHFAADHATAAGHFPGNPIIPGALLLDEVVHAIAAHAGDGRGIVIRSAKFLRPIRPGDSLRVQWSACADGAITFECHAAIDGRLAARGMIEIGRIPR
jgi:3-hydroxyacyl-[acyl-carrier-protein] dehydratase